METWYNLIGRFLMMLIKEFCFQTDLCKSYRTEFRFSKPFACDTPTDRPMKLPIEQWLRVSLTTLRILMEFGKCLHSDDLRLRNKLHNSATYRSKVTTTCRKCLNLSCVCTAPPTNYTQKPSNLDRITLRPVRTEFLRCSFDILPQCAHKGKIQVPESYLRNAFTYQTCYVHSGPRPECDELRVHATFRDSATYGSRYIINKKKHVSAALFRIDTKHCTWTQ